MAGGHDLPPFRLAEGKDPLRFPGDLRAENSDVDLNLGPVGGVGHMAVTGLDRCTMRLQRYPV
jgi:hypothetical protein